MDSETKKNKNAVLCIFFPHCHINNLLLLFFSPPSLISNIGRYHPPLIILLLNLLSYVTGRAVYPESVRAGLFSSTFLSPRPGLIPAAFAVYGDSFTELVGRPTRTDELHFMMQPPFLARHSRLHANVQ